MAKISSRDCFGKQRFNSIATTSGAIAESLGYKDEEQIPFEELFYVVQRIKSCTSIPISVDLERGYTNDAEVLTAQIQQLIDIGVSGINLEDAQGENIYLKKLDAIKNYLLKTGQQLFLNARTDVFLQKLELPLETTLRRAKLYQDARADGLFVTAVPDLETIRKIVQATTLPVNVVGLAKLYSVADLAASGVKRISMAVFLYKAAYNQLETLANEIIKERSTGVLFN